MTRSSSARRPHPRRRHRPPASPTSKIDDHRRASRPAAGGDEVITGTLARPARPHLPRKVGARRPGVVQLVEDRTEQQAPSASPTTSLRPTIAGDRADRAGWYAYAQRTFAGPRRLGDHRAASAASDHRLRPTPWAWPSPPPSWSAPAVARGILSATSTPCKRPSDRDRRPGQDRHHHPSKPTSRDRRVRRRGRR
jgi:hypothetical protein